MSTEELAIKIRADVEEAVDGFRRVQDETNKTQQSMRNLVTGLSGVATSAFSLYNAWDNVQDMQVSVSRANFQVQSSLNSLEDAQRKYNATVEKYGANSEQATAAAKDLQLAQERYSVAVDRAEMVQGNLNETIVRSALTVIPSMITMIDSVCRAKQAWATAQTVLNAAMAANPIGLVITVIAALVSILIVAYTTCEPFRNAVNALGATLLNFFKPAIEAVINVVNSLGQVWNAICSGIKTVWDATVGPLIAGIQDFANTVQGTFQTLFGWIVGGSIWRDLCGGLGTIWNTYVSSLIGSIQGFANTVIGTFQGVSNTLSGIWNGIVGFINGAVSNVTRMASTATSAASTAQTAASTAAAAAKAATTSVSVASGATAKSVIEGGSTITATKTTTTTTPTKEPTPVVTPYGIYYAQYGGFGIVKKPTVFVAGERGPEAFAFEPLVGGMPAPERPLSIAIGAIHVVAQDLGSRFDRDRTAEVFAKELAHKLALRVITR